MTRSIFSNPLPGVPDVESPFFEEIFSNKEISHQTLDLAHQMRERGYAIIDFPDAEFENRTNRIIESLGKNFDFEMWKRDLWPKNDGLRIQDAWKDNSDVLSLATNPTVLKILSDLYGRKPIPFQTLNFPVGTQQSVHNDQVHFSSIPERFMCGVWIAMEDIDDDNGALEYYPGSHKFQSFVNEHISACSAQQEKPLEHYSKYTDLWKKLIEKYEIKPERFHAKKGQALIWSSNLLHGGIRHADQARTRWTQVTHYFFENCAYYTPMLSDPAFGKTKYRSIIDIATEKNIPNIYSGHEIPTSVIDGFYATPNDTAITFIPEGFDPENYLTFNPDVAAAGIDARTHFLEFGFREQRRWK